MDSTITTVRHVSTWYYLLTALTAITAITWLARRRLLKFGAQLLGFGIVLNALWELALFTIWGRQYETPAPAILQAVYQSLTEFGPLLVLVVLVLSNTRFLALEPWQEPRKTRLHSVITTLGLGLLIGWGSLVLTLVITTPTTLSSSVIIIRHITPVYFIAGVSLAIIVLAIAVNRSQRIALLLFVVMGTLNVLVEVIGLIGGYRTYDGLTAYASLLIGLPESGTAAVIVWMAATTTVMDRETPSESGFVETPE